MCHMQRNKTLLWCFSSCKASDIPMYLVNKTVYDFVCCINESEMVLWSHLRGLPTHVIIVSILEWDGTEQ